MRVGAHESIAGGLWRAVERGEAYGARALQVFTSNQQQWAPRALPDDEATRFRAGVRAARLDGCVMTHGSYLVNAASPDPALRARSTEAIAGELTRCARLGIPFVVMHPGSPGDDAASLGIERVAQAVAEAYAQAADEAASHVTVLFENTAAQGKSLGGPFEHLRDLLGACERARVPRRPGVCFDTCHALAAGHELRTEEGYEATFAALDAAVGLASVRAFHLNDALKDLGSRLDRHARIGEGFLGDAFFARLMRDPRFADTPGVLETPPLEGGEMSFASGVERLRALQAGTPVVARATPVAAAPGPARAARAARTAKPAKATKPAKASKPTRPKKAPKPVPARKSAKPGRATT